MNKHKAVRIPDSICQKNKNLSTTFNPRNTCRMEFTDHLGLLFIDRPQSDVVVFSIIYLDVLKKSSKII